MGLTRAMGRGTEAEEEEEGCGRKEEVEVGGWLREDETEELAVVLGTLGRAPDLR